MGDGRPSPKRGTLGWKRSQLHSLLRSTEASQAGTGSFVWSQPPSQWAVPGRWHTCSWLVRSAFSVGEVTGLAKCQSQPVPGPAQVPACLAREPQPLVPGELCQSHGHGSP